MLRCLAFLLMVLLPLCGQERMPLPLPMPGIRIKQEDRSQPAQLHDLRIGVKVVGHVATTTWELTVYNPQDRVLEGELVFPLGEGQTVTRFAMDVNGRLREGVVVEKAKGRIAFEAIVRRNVDPGLLEKTAGNSFKARVYPIPAKGYKRVVLAYEQELPDAGSQDLLYQLPLAFAEKVANFGLRVEVLDQPVAPRATSSPLANFAFKAVQRAFVAEETRQDFAPSTPLAVVIPRGEASGQVFVERRDGQAYFFAMVHPRLPRGAKVLPKRLLIVWDASASARSRDLKRELDLLEAYLKKLGTTEVSLAVFRNATEPLRTFAVREGNAQALRAHLEALPLDGATSLGALDLQAMKVDETLLFTDGMNTFGPGAAIFPEAPLVALNSALTAEHGLLRAFSEGRGGEYLNLQGLSSEQALKALATRPLAFLRATYGVGEVEELYPSASLAVRGPFGLAGLLKAQTAKVTLHFGFGATTRFTKTFEIDTKAAVDAPVARLWAQKKLAELELDKTKNAQAITALGQAHSLVTEGTSLIVLDELADYVRYRITPPEELRAEYERRIGEQKNDAKRQDREHLEGLVKQFEERKTWWKTEFKAPKGHIKKERSKQELDVAYGYSNSMAPPPPPPPPPPPAPIDLSRDVVPEIAPRELPTVNRSLATTRLALAPGVAGGTAAAPAESAASITLKPWSPDTPYLKDLKAAPKAERYGLYLKQRDTYGKTPGFFLDVSDLFREQGEKELALRILSNLAELKLEDAALLRVLGQRLRQLGFHDLAVWTFGEVLRMREEEPQSRRDLALACAEANAPQRAVELLWEVASKRWDGRFHDVNLIALGELNALVATAKTTLDASVVDPRLRENLPVDIRVVLNWDTDNSDMDLHVIDPRGETCYYSHNRTAIGGRISADVTDGYGPEEFLLKKAIPGTYRVQANFFGTRQQTAVGATTVVLELYLRYGTGRMENKSITLRLDGGNRMVDIGSFTFGEK